MPFVSALIWIRLQVSTTSDGPTPLKARKHPMAGTNSLNWFAAIERWMTFVEHTISLAFPERTR